MESSPEGENSGPAQETVRLPANLPTIAAGTAVTPPGPWAAFIMQKKWKIAYKNNCLKTALLCELVRQPPLREPTLRRRCKRIASPEIFERYIGSVIPNVEAVWIQIVGIVSENQCWRFQRRLGPFTHCVTFNGINGCGNCQWWRKKRRCDFYHSPQLVSDLHATAPMANPQASVVPTLPVNDLAQRNEEVAKLLKELRRLEGQIKEHRMALREASLACGSTIYTYERIPREDSAEWARFQTDQYAEMLRVNRFTFQRMEGHVEKIENLTQEITNCMATLATLA
ncbi:hypothetical protein N7486_008731 [Penicillium sp. IBT 16267x]|nr:hypothetical protein N7486_008731 [Penicillium sp. IBT 16267x]